MPTILLKKKPNALSMYEPLRGVNSRTYNRIFGYLKRLNYFQKIEDKSRQQKEMYVLSNYAFIVYDKIKHNNTWDVDYNSVKAFSAKNRPMVRYVLKDCFRVDLLDFEKWMHFDVDLLEMSMHRSSNSYNKHIFK